MDRKRITKKVLSKLKTSSKEDIKDKIGKKPESLWIVEDFSGSNSSKYLEELTKENYLTKYKVNGKSVYYKIQDSMFGKLTSPSHVEFKLVDKLGIDYFMVGLAVYNGLGLTTQVPSIVEYISDKEIKFENVSKSSRDWEYVKSNFSKYKNMNQKEVSVIWAINNHKNIPDTTDTKIVKMLWSIISDEKISFKKIEPMLDKEPKEWMLKNKEK
ncbi:hypothetical protein N9948_00245 [bacterium]|nr:hypothetical protein [bacterium]